MAQSYQHFSKSTKRRRFLEEVEIVDIFRENSTSETQVSQETVGPQTSFSEINILDDSVGISQNIQFFNSSNEFNSQLNVDKIEVLGSDSDSSSDREVLSVDFLNNDNE